MQSSVQQLCKFIETKESVRLHKKKGELPQGSFGTLFVTFVSLGQFY